MPTDSIVTRSGGTPRKCSASCSATWSGAVANSPPSAYSDSPMRTDGKYAGAAQAAMATSTTAMCSSPVDSSACGVLNTLVWLRVMSTAGTTTLCSASPSVRRPRSRSSSSRSTVPLYFGPSTARDRSSKRATAPRGSARGENTSAPRPWNSRTTRAISTSKAIASAAIPPTEVPAMRSKRRPSGSPTRFSSSASTVAVYSPR